jgi:hypothetical protein
MALIMLPFKRKSQGRDAALWGADRGARGTVPLVKAPERNFLRSAMRYLKLAAQ